MLTTWIRSKPVEPMYLIYLDDSKQDKSRDKFEVLSAVLVDDQSFPALEAKLGYLHEIIEPHVTDPTKFVEIHAADLLAGNSPFEKIQREWALTIFGEALTAIDDLKIPVIYSAVDLNKLYASNYATTNPIDMAFRMGLRQIEEWFGEYHPANFGLLIADDGDGKVKNSMLNAFHLFRRPVVSSPPRRGELSHVHDDMYFGSSKFSRGIQLADLCSLLIGRHLAGYSDTEALYKELSRHIVKSSVKPD